MHQLINYVRHSMTCELALMCVINPFFNVNDATAATNLFTCAIPFATDAYTIILIKVGFPKFSLI